MKIRSLSLHNVKSYDETSPAIQFHTGVNAIIGENGSGKSTLCEAVGFVLFDFLHPYSQADFVREGHKSGKISITFVSDQNDQVYRVERGVGQSKYDVFNVTNNKKLSLNGKDDVVSWLKDTLGVPSSMDLHTIWKSSLGVPQGKFTNDFAETPTIRAQLFNPLLEVDVYRNLWQKMKGVIDVLTDKKTTVSEHIAGLESVVKELPDLERQVKERKNQIKEANQAILRIKKEILSIENQKMIFESLEKEIEKLVYNLNLSKEKQGEIKKQFDQSQQQLDEAKKARDIINKSSEKYEQYLSIAKHLDQLLIKRKEQEALQKRKNVLETTLSRIEERFIQVQKEVEIATQSKKEMDSLKTLVKKQENLEEKLADLLEKEKEMNRFKKEIQHIQEMISKLRRDYQTLEKQITEISEKKKIAKKKTSLQQQKEVLFQKQSVLDHQQKENEKILSLLESRTESVCPTCSRPLDESHRSELLFAKQKEIRRVKKKQNDISNQLQELTKEVREAENADEEVKRLNDLETMNATIQREADEFKKKKDLLDETVLTIKEELIKKGFFQQELDKLDNPKQAFQRAKIRFDDYKDKTDKRDQLKEKLDHEKREVAQVSQELAKFSGIQKELSELEQKQKKLKKFYELYLQHKDLALKGDYWAKLVKNLSSTLDKITQDIKVYIDNLSAKKKVFNKDDLAQLKKDFEEKKTQHAQRDAQKNEWVKQTKDLEKKVSEKQQQKKELFNLQKNSHSIDKDIEFAQFLRETYQKSRPIITEILVEEISREADRIYRELRGVPSEELAWKKDYEIVVYESGNSRAFHKLSGGEKMCAALAVRLAILKLLSTMDIVFLDEPTTNLDEEKKENLVSQLRELSGFSQIFVISHDETFESMTEHVITLEKRNGATQLLTHFQGGF